MEGSEILVTDSNQLVSSVDEMVEHVRFIQNVMHRVMLKGQHYGVIPGCGDKPALLKPGAEKILEAFRLAPDPIVEDLSTSDEIRYRVKVRITHQITGKFIGAGIGECSSGEEKYKWRSAVNDEEFNATPEDRKRLKYKKGWNGRADEKIKQIRTNPSDQANTILKMAKKRALVDGAITVTSASDIFAQDIDEMEVEVPPQAAPTPISQAPQVDLPPLNSEMDPVQDVLSKLAKLCNQDEAEMESLTRVLSSFSKDGKDFSFGLKDIGLKFERSPGWFKTFRAKVSNSYHKKFPQ